MVIWLRSRTYYFAVKNQDGPFWCVQSYLFQFWSVIILDRSNQFKKLLLLYKILSKSWHIVIPIDVIVRKIDTVKYKKYKIYVIRFTKICLYLPLEEKKKEASISNEYPMLNFAIRILKIVGYIFG